MGTAWYATRVRPGETPKLNRDDVLGTIGPLRMIVLGALLCVFDYVPAALDGPRLRVDVVNDAVGALLIAAGVFRLGRLRVHNPWNNHYGQCMRFVKGVAVLTVAECVMGHLVFAHPPVLDIALSILGIVRASSALLLCICFRWALRAAPLPRTTRLWDIVATAVLALLTGPVFCFHFARFWTLMAGVAPARPAPSSATLFGLIVSVPLLMMYWFTYRLEAEARSADFDAAGPEAHG